METPYSLSELHLLQAYKAHAQTFIKTLIIIFCWFWVCPMQQWPICLCAPALNEVVAHIRCSITFAKWVKAVNGLHFLSNTAKSVTVSKWSNILDHKEKRIYHIWNPVALLILKFTHTFNHHSYCSSCLRGNRIPLFLRLSVISRTQ